MSADAGPPAGGAEPGDVPVGPGPLAAVLRLGARALWGFAIGLAGAWLLGVAIGDRWLWSQYLWWIPAIAAGAGASLLCLMGWLLWGLGAWASARCARRRGFAPVRARPWLGLAGLVACLVPLIGFALMDWGWSGAAPERPRPASGSGETFRVGYLNAMSGLEAEPIAWASSWSSDLFVLANARPIRIPDGRAALEEAGLTGAQLIRWRRFYVVSRWPVVERGVQWLGLRGRVRDTGGGKDSKDAPSFDNGLAGYLILQPPEGDRIVVWAIDLPSDVRWPRARMASLARFRIDQHERPDGSKGFPAPDIIVGDFNTPRGSASLPALVGPDLRSAFAAGGRGYGATWPRELPLWHIDQIFIDPGRWRVAAHALPDPGAGTHRGVVADLRRR